jgi:hypothetical protein
VSRLVSWHFRGLERQCHPRFGVEGILHACKTKSKDLHSTYPIRYRESLSECVSLRTYIPSLKLNTVLCYDMQAQDSITIQFLHTETYIFDSGCMTSSLLTIATRLGPSFLKSTSTTSS